MEKQRERWIKVEKETERQRAAFAQQWWTNKNDCASGNHTK